MLSAGQLIGGAAMLRCPFRAYFGSWILRCAACYCWLTTNHAPSSALSSPSIAVLPGMTAERLPVAPLRVAFMGEGGEAFGEVLAGKQVVERCAGVGDGIDDIRDAAGFLHDLQGDAH